MFFKIYNHKKKKNPIQIYQAFGLMDQDRDGTISMDDLKEVYNSLGKLTN